MEPLEVLYLQVRVDLGVMTMKAYFTLSRSPDLESKHQRQFSVITKTLQPSRLGRRTHRPHLCRGVSSPPTPNEYPGMTLNHLIVRLHTRSLGEFGVPFNHHYFEVNTDLVKQFYLSNRWNPNS